MKTAIGSTHPTLSWEEPPCGERHGYIHMYSYILTNSRNGENVTGNTTDREVTFQGLVPSVEYFASVSAWTSIGQGPASLVSLLTGQTIKTTTLTTSFEPFTTIQDKSELINLYLR